MEISHKDVEHVVCIVFQTLMLTINWLSASFGDSPRSPTWPRVNTGLGQPRVQPDTVPVWWQCQQSLDFWHGSGLLWVLNKTEVVWGQYQQLLTITSSFLTQGYLKLNSGLSMLTVSTSPKQPWVLGPALAWSLRIRLEEALGPKQGSWAAHAQSQGSTYWAALQPCSGTMGARGISCPIPNTMYSAMHFWHGRTGDFWDGV